MKYSQKRKFYGLDLLKNLYFREINYTNYSNKNPFFLKTKL